MATDINLVEEKEIVPMNSSYLNKGKTKFLQIIKGTIRQTCFQKHALLVRNCTHFGWPPPC